MYQYSLCGTLQTLPIPGTAAAQNSFQSPHKKPLWTGKNLVLIVRVGWIIRLSSKASKGNSGRRCSSWSSTTMSAQRPPELRTIQLHSRARGGSFSRGRDRGQNTGGVLRNDFWVLPKWIWILGRQGLLASREDLSHFSCIKILQHLISHGLMLSDMKWNKKVGGMEEITSANY